MWGVKPPGTRQRGSLKGMGSENCASEQCCNMWYHVVGNCRVKQGWDKGRADRYGQPDARE